MLYEEHFTLNEKTKRAERNYYKILEEKEELLATVRPSSVSGNEKESKTNAKSDPFTNYVAMIEEIETRLQIAKNILNEYQYNLKTKTIELEASADVYDKIYLNCFIGKHKVNQIVRLLPYSLSAVYNFKEQIEKKLDLIKKNLLKD